jgi:hypothetical protein
MATWLNPSKTPLPYYATIPKGGGITKPRFAKLFRRAVRRHFLARQ